jgi:hypothetical protein
LKELALLLAITALPLPVHAFLGTAIKVGVRDAATNKPLDGAFVVVREFADVGQLHGSSTYCVRAQVAVANAPSFTLKLPHPGTDMLTRARALEGLAYRPGYCLARIGNAAAAARHKRVSMGMAAPAELDASADNRFSMQRAAQTVEERLLHLEQAAHGLACHEARWGDGSKEAMGRLAEAMLGEASSIAKTRYEKHLAQRIGATIAVARDLGKAGPMPSAPYAVIGGAETRFTRDFIVAPSNARIAWSDAKRPIVAIAGPAAMSVAVAAAPPGAPVPPVSAAPTPSPRPTNVPVLAPQPVAPPVLAIHCKHGAPSACDLDERDADGATALYGFARAGRPDEVRVLLEAGADPNATKGPRGDTAMDVAVRQVLLNYDSAEKAAQVLDVLAADPRTTIRPALREALADDPSSWRNVHSAPARERLLKRREALLRLPVAAAERAPSCEDPHFDPMYSYNELPPRLR